MTLEEQKAIVDSILANHTDQGQVSTSLATLIDDYGKVLSELETAKNTVASLTEDNEEIRKANFKLFKQIGEVPNKKEQQLQEELEDKSKDFGELFDENGNLL
jgi:regulator of replication initiation timing